MNFDWARRIGILIIGVSACVIVPVRTQGQDSSAFFKQHCAACHTIGGGRLVGPDLKGVTSRKDRAWLVKFMQDPSAMINSGDPYAAQLKLEAHGLLMPTVPGMTPELANALLDMISSGSPGQAASASPGLSDRPFTPGDVTLGKELFLGDHRLANGGPPCVSCHTLGTLGGLGGGRLGPDLTNALDRLGGRRGLGVWLSSPPTTTMQSVFGQHALLPREILPILAVIDNASKQSKPAGNSSILRFFAWGLTGMLLGLALLQFAWRGRLRSVRRPIVRAHIRGGQ